MSGLSNDPYSKNSEPIIGLNYNRSLRDFPPPPDVETKEKEKISGILRKGHSSIFNRYSVFFFNNNSSFGKGPVNPENYIDSSNRLNLDGDKLKVYQNPTAANIINWTKGGGSNSIEYDWADFLWCKNYGAIPNNYLVTLRKFSVPAGDDLTDPIKTTTPDIGRLITWVDGETNKFDNVGLKFSYNVEWKELKSEIQKINTGAEQGNEGGAFTGKLAKVGTGIKAVAASTQPGIGSANLSNPGAKDVNPYDNANKVWGPIDVVNKMMIRDVGLTFAQEISLVFEYELKSIDGINPKVAMIDLLSNVLLCTYSRGAFWGGEVRYWGGDPKRIKPLGDPSKLSKGDFSGYLSSLIGGLMGRFDNLTDGAGFSAEGIANAGKTLFSNGMSNIVGKGLDDMGRPAMHAINSLLTGEDTGQWHLMVGNPANPMISIGNLILKKTDLEFGGALGPDDFPNKLKVTCTLEPARPRDRTDIMAMFHRNGRTYLTKLPESSETFSPKIDLNKRGNPNSIDVLGDFYSKAVSFGSDFLSQKFPNHKDKPNQITETAKGIY